MCPVCNNDLVDFTKDENKHVNDYTEYLSCINKHFYYGGGIGKTYPILFKEDFYSNIDKEKFERFINDNSVSN